MDPSLSERERQVLEAVIETYVATAEPAGSRTIAKRFGLALSAATIRNTMSDLEEKGYLYHPHTSAGRVPTEAGYRYFVDRLLPQKDLDARPPQRLSLSLVRREVDEAMRVTTEALSQVTNLLAIVTAPPIDTSTIRHIEVLVLQPQVVMVVVITSTGGVTRRLFTFDRAVDPGLADWAASYLNERLVGLGVGARMLHQRLYERSLSATESAFMEALAPAFTALEDSTEETLYVEGASRLLQGERFDDVSELQSLMDMLERRVTLLAVLRSALSERGVLVRIGHENDAPALRSLAFVAASYGLPQRRLGAVSVIGPLRMDYGHAIRSVRQAAFQLSHFVADVYDER
jgi:heat-inducible transcriptional repressor